MDKPKTALVCGAGGFIGHHLVNYLKDKGYWVRGVDIKLPDFCDTNADQFYVKDLRNFKSGARTSCVLGQGLGDGFDEVYQLAADMGGMGFIHSAECDIVRNNTLINLNMIRAVTDPLCLAKRYLFSSSACVYRDQVLGDSRLAEEDAYPAFPDNEYGWEKLYAERVAMTHGRHNDLEVRIARFQNCYGPYGTWKGGREKAPAALCRKIADATPVGPGLHCGIEIWGDGTAERNFIYVDDLCEGIYTLMQSDMREPVNIGTDEITSVNDFVNIIAQVAGKTIFTHTVEGPVGVLGRYETFDKIKSLGWKPKYSLKEGIEKLYPWIEQEMKNPSDVALKKTRPMEKSCCD